MDAALGSSRVVLFSVFTDLLTQKDWGTSVSAEAIPLQVKDPTGTTA